MFEQPAIAPCVDIVPASGHGLPWFVSIAFVAVVGASSSVWLRTVLALNELVSYRPVGCEALVHARNSGISAGAFDVPCGPRKAVGRSRERP